MRANYNRNTKRGLLIEEILNHPQYQTVYNLLESKGSNYGVYKWVKEHADYLEYFDTSNYNIAALRAMMDLYTKVFAEMKDSADFKTILEISTVAVFELDENCRKGVA